VCRRQEGQEVNWTNYSFNINGKTIIVKVPKGENPPPTNPINRKDDCRKNKNYKRITGLTQLNLI